MVPSPAHNGIYRWLRAL